MKQSTGMKILLIITTIAFSILAIASAWGARPFA
jgi:hypothetical protein